MELKEIKKALVDKYLQVNYINKAVKNDYNNSWIGGHEKDPELLQIEDISKKTGDTYRLYLTKVESTEGARAIDYTESEIDNLIKYGAIDQHIFLPEDHYGPNKLIEIRKYRIVEYNPCAENINKEEILKDNLKLKENLPFCDYD